MELVVESIVTVAAGVSDPRRGAPGYSELGAAGRALIAIDWLADTGVPHSAPRTGKAVNRAQPLEVRGARLLIGDLSLEV